MTLRQGLVLTSDADSDAPDLPAVATVSKDDEWDHGAYDLGVAAAARGRLWCDRPYFTGNPTVDWLVARCDRVTDGGGWCQAGNEQNLPLEGWAGGPEAWWAFDAAVRARVKRPDRLLAMPPSPGTPDWWGWVTPEGPYAVHAYGGLAQMQAVVESYLAHADGEIVITECNPGAGNTFDLDEWAATDLVAFLDWCAGEERILGVTYFAWVWHGAPVMPASVDAKGSMVPGVLAEWTPPMNGGSDLPSIAALRDTVWSCAEQAEAIGWPWLGQAWKAAIALSKGEQ